MTFRGGSGISVDFAPERAVLSVRGRLDLHSAPELAAFFDTAIASGYSAVVLDLTALAFVSNAGLRVIASAAHRLGAAGGQLTIRSPSARVRRMLEGSGLAREATFEPPHQSLVRVRPERARPPPRPVAGSGYDELAQHLSRVPVPAADRMVDGVLRLVVALALATVDRADGVSVSLHRHGRLATVAASNQTVVDMDAEQYDTAEGPCIDASIEGRAFHVESPNTETRWPAFIPRAKALGINTILSSPLLALDRPVGALNIYSSDVAAFEPKDQLVASMLATEASIILTDAAVDVADDQLTSRLQQALRARQIIDQAQGVLMERDGVSEDAAYKLLRRASVGTGRPLLQQANDIVASTLGPRPRPGRGSAGAQHG